MVKITNVLQEDDYIVIEYLTNGITVSTRVYNTEALTPQEIAQKGYDEIEPHIQMECDNLEITADHKLEVVEDEVIKIVLLGIDNLNFTEGQQPVDKSFRCTGYTKFGKTISLTDKATFSPGQTIKIDPTESKDISVSVTYGKLTDTKTFTISYITKAEIEKQIEDSKKSSEEEVKRALESLKATKKNEFSELCNKSITDGFVSTIHFGTEKTYELQLENQLNMTDIANKLLLNIQFGLKNPETVSYYPKGETLTEYPIIEFVQLYEVATNFKTEQITKYKNLVEQVNACTTIESINAITW